MESDTLRARIAELQRAHMPIDYAGGIDCTCGDNFHPEHGGIDVAEPLWAEHVADAVIRELNTNCVGYQIWHAAEWINVNSGGEPYEMYRNVDGSGGGWRVTVQRIEADDD